MMTDLHQTPVYTTPFGSWADSVPPLLEAAGLAATLRNRSRVLIKPNLVENLDPPITTPVELIESLVDYIRDQAPDTEIIIGEGCGSLEYDTPHCFQALGYGALADASSLKRELVEGLDILIVRELTGGVYFGEPRGIEDLPNGERRGVNTQVYTTSEIRRVGRVAFDLAKKRKSRLCSVEKSNVMETGVLWREEVQWLHDNEFADAGVELSHMLADNCAMQLVRQPKQFDVIVTDNLFGDMLSDAAAMLTGSLGMLPSASLGDVDDSGRRKALYEPVHGTAPDIAGQGLANPLAMIGSLAMALKYSCHMDEEADRLDQAIANTLERGLRTADIVEAGAKAVSTGEMGAAVRDDAQQGLANLRGELDRLLIGESSQILRRLDPGKNVEFHQ